MFVSILGTFLPSFVEIEAKLLQFLKPQIMPIEVNLWAPLYILLKNISRCPYLVVSAVVCQAISITFVENDEKVPVVNFNKR